MHRILVITPLVVLGLAALPTSAAAGSYPAHPAGVRVTSVAHTSFTVGLDKSANAHSYRLYVSRTKSDVFESSIEAGTTSSSFRVFSSSTPSLTASGLAYTSDPYYLRVAAVNGSIRAFSSRYWSLGLRPTTPTSLHVSGNHLAWNSGPATGFTIEQATNAAMTTGVVTRTIRGEAHVYTPYRLASGSTYYFRVRAVAQKTPSTYTGVVSLAAQGGQQNVRLMSYNILQTSYDGRREQGGVVAPWLQRRPAVAGLIKSVDPDVLAVQEGGQWVGDEANHLRQVDSLNRELRAIGLTYTISATEATWGQPGYHRTGDYVLYKPSVYRAFAAGGHWALSSDQRWWAAYQPLENIATGARFLFVSAHLLPNGGASYDVERQTETKRLVADASSLAATLGVPVVYAGDFNSDRLHTPDGPMVVMRGAHVSDARLVAQWHANERFDTMNQYRRTPPAYSLDIDYFFADPGVAVTTWGTALRLSKGKFVGTIPSDHNPVYAQVLIPYQN